MHTIQTLTAPAPAGHYAQAVVHNGLVTSRSPADLEAFCAKGRMRPVLETARSDPDPAVRAAAERALAALGGGK